ncbi:hypothetical protein BCR42DRAFT_421946 [Absidia repens]|uniref:Uncharacterized protein n=1 Tax=Absidia repens TaxID=90262 RepID=A0A1X2I7B5_9FUNG|nr:hypothetical protein BCR42DRAFT_421946 [Absidia repens]
MVQQSLVILSLVLCFITSAISADEMLSVYHKRGGDYLKRGDIIDIPYAPKYVPTEHSKGDLLQGLYQIKIKNDKTGHVTLSSIPSCHLKASNFTDQFRIHLDHQQRIYHVDYYADSFDCQSITENGETEPFTSDIQIIKAVDGAKPVLGQVNGKQKPQTTAKPTRQRQAADTEGEGRDEEDEEEKTFFQKYWYLLLAGAFMLMSNAVAPPEPAQQGGGRGTQAPRR